MRPNPYSPGTAQYAHIANANTQYERMANQQQSQINDRLWKGLGKSPPLNDSDRKKGLQYTGGMYGCLALCVFIPGVASSEKGLQIGLLVCAAILFLAAILSCLCSCRFTSDDDTKETSRLKPSISSTPEPSLEKRKLFAYSSICLGLMAIPFTAAGGASDPPNQIILLTIGVTLIMFSCISMACVYKQSIPNEQTRLV